MAGRLNSTMVRLKQKHPIVSLLNYISLNSTMVRLKQMKNLKEKICNNWSQFHYGSIKTKTVTRSMEWARACLNSTMVRLKQKERNKNERIWILSQFHYGSIKTCQVLDNKKIANLSQFHYGSIKTINVKNKSYRVKYVSIPLWFD